MSKIVRKHSAKCLQITVDSGEIRHYVLIGNNWYYNGRSGLTMNGFTDSFAKDGFWTDTIVQIIDRRGCGTLEDVINLNIYLNGGNKPKVGKPHIREWLSASESLIPDCPF